MKQKQIVVATAGWVLIGAVEDAPEGIIIHEASVIRRWGTTAGLGELAVKGPTKDTILDYTGEVHIKNAQVILRIPCRV